MDDNSKVIILKYLIDFTKISKDKLIQTIHECLPEDEDLFMGMTVREQFIQEAKEIGLQQGMQQGMAQEKQSIAASMLDKGFDLRVIEEVTGVTRDFLMNLKQQKRH